MKADEKLKYPVINKDISHGAHIRNSIEKDTHYSIVVNHATWIYSCRAYIAVTIKLKASERVSKRIIKHHIAAAAEELAREKKSF